MISKLLYKLFGPKKQSHASKLYGELVAEEKQYVMRDAEPVKYTLKTEIPKFAETLAKLHNKSLDEYMEFLLVECLYANRLHHSPKLDGYMPPTPYGKPSKYIN